MVGIVIFSVLSSIPTVLEASFAPLLFWLFVCVGGPQERKQRQNVYLKEKCFSYNKSVLRNNNILKNIGPLAEQPIKYRDSITCKNPSLNFAMFVM